MADKRLSTLQKINFIVSTKVAYLRRTYRVYDLSMFDYLGSYLIIYLLLVFSRTPLKAMYFTAMLPTAVLAHILTGQKTPYTVKFTNKEVNIEKIYVLFLIIWTIQSYNST